MKKGQAETIMELLTNMPLPKRVSFEIGRLMDIKRITKGAVAPSNLVIDITNAAVVRTVEEQLVALTAYVLEQKHTEEHSRTIWIQFPASPWQFLKKRLYERWPRLLRWCTLRYPVKLRSHEAGTSTTHTYIRICPHVEIADPTKAHVHYTWLKEPSEPEGT